MARIDLDAARQAEQEENGEPHVLVFGGREFKVVAAPAAGFLIGLGRVAKGDLSGLETALKALLVDPADLDSLMDLGLTVNDLGPIVSGAYGVDLGEAPASE
jgi:hypothetical protein